MTRLCLHWDRTTLAPGQCFTFIWVSNNCCWCNLCMKCVWYVQLHTLENIHYTHTKTRSAGQKTCPCTGLHCDCFYLVFHTADEGDTKKYLCRTNQQLESSKLRGKLHNLWNFSHLCVHNFKGLLELSPLAMYGRCTRPMMGLRPTTEPNQIFYWDYNRLKAQSGRLHALGGRTLFRWPSRSAVTIGARCFDDLAAAHYPMAHAVLMVGLC